MPEGNVRPYVGPRSFLREDSPMFFGRDRDVSELEACIVAHGEVLLYAQSGAGKTSLINAKLIPNLEKRHFDVTAGARVKGPIVTSDPSKVENIFVFNALTSLAPKEDTGKLLTMRLGDFLKAREHAPDEDGLTRPRLVIFDQFEEIFTFYPDRWQQRRGFFEQLRDALNADPLLRVLLSMREDHVAEIEPYSPILPEQLRTRFRLERLRRDSSVTAITKPLEVAGYEFEEGVPRRLVTELLQIRHKSLDGKFLTTEGEFVEAVQLQVVCETLWDSLPKGQRVITHRQLSDVGDVDAVLQRFYETSLAKAVATGRVREGALRDWFEHELITPAGTRGTVYRGDEITGKVPNEAVDVIENQHLIRGELRGGAIWYELTHDRLIEPIRKSGRDWLIKGKLQALEERAAAWDGERKNGLLTQAEWEEANKLLEGSEARTLGQTDKLREFVEASRSALDLEDSTQREAWSFYRYFDKSAIGQQRMSRRITTATVALPLMVIVAVLVQQRTSILESNHSTIFGLNRSPTFDFWWYRSTHIIALIGPIAVASLLAGMTRFRYTARWALFRGAAEAIKSEIFKYRARGGAYAHGDMSVALRLSAATRSILGSLAQTEINRGQIAQGVGEIPPELLAPLTGAEYLRTRVEEQIEFFQYKTRSLDRRLKTLQWALYLICGLATFLAALGFDHWAGITCGFLLAWFTVDANYRIEDSLVQYNQVLAALLSVRGWWEALTSSEKTQNYNIDQLVQKTEEALKMELAGWVQEFRPAPGTASSESAGMPT